jgi:hypothetical protein
MNHETTVNITAYVLQMNGAKDGSSVSWGCRRADPDVRQVARIRMPSRGAWDHALRRPGIDTLRDFRRPPTVLTSRAV